jgi:RNA polymerase sigma-70 factor (ECF subfamily)
LSGLAPGEPSDAILLRRHAAGDADAFGVLFRRHKDRLWAVALRIACDPDDAADALQEAMISAFRRAGDFRGESAVTTWLHRIVVNAALSTASTDSRLDVDAALRTLPPPQRAALVLVDMLGYSVADASAILGVSEGTVKSRCARGRAKLLPYLAHLRGDFPGRGNQAVSDGVPSEQGGGA